MYSEKFPSVTVVEQVLRRICAKNKYIDRHFLVSWLLALGYEVSEDDATVLLTEFEQRFFLNKSKHVGRYTINPNVVYLPDADYYADIWDMDTVELYELLANRLAESGTEILDMLAELVERATFVENGYQMWPGGQEELVI